jgi:hypothetical protein
VPKRILSLVPRQQVIVQAKRIVINCRSRLPVPRCPSGRRVSSRTHTDMSAASAMSHGKAAL